MKIFDTKLLHLFIILSLLYIPIATAQQTVYNNFGPDHNGFDYNFGLGWTIAGDNVQAQYGVQQAMAFQSNLTGTVSDIWVAIFYVPLDPGLDTVTIMLTPFHQGLPPDSAEIMEEWTITDFGSWSQWNPPQHLQGNGSSQLQDGEWYWLWAVGGETTWCGWAMNLDPTLTAPHTIRREGENWLPISNETASAFRVDVVPITPVELTSFAADINTNGEVLLKWSTATETNNRTFEIERKSNTKQFTTIGFRDGNGTTTEPKSYSFIDKNVENGSYTYRLKQIDFNGQFKYSNEVDVNVTKALTFNLEQNYPNPFNPTTVISWQSSSDSWQTLKVYDVLGNEVKTLVDKFMPAGKHYVEFNASNLASGIYFYQLKENNKVLVKKMTVMK